MKWAGFNLIYLSLMTSQAMAEVRLFNDGFINSAALSNYQELQEGSVGCSSPVILSNKLIVDCPNNGGLAMILKNFSGHLGSKVDFEVFVTVIQWNDSSGPGIGVGYGISGSVFEPGSYQLMQAEYPTADHKVKIRRNTGGATWAAISGGPAMPQPGAAHTYRYVGRVTRNFVKLQVYEGNTLLVDLVWNDAVPTVREGGNVTLICREARCEFDDLKVRIVDEVDSGLRFKASSSPIPYHFSAEIPSNLNSPFRIRKSGQTMGLILVNPGDTAASNFFIQTATDKKVVKVLEAE